MHMITSQYRESVRDPQHPLQQELYGPPPDRVMKKSALNSDYPVLVFSCDPENPEREREKNRKRLHTHFVQQHLEQQPDHRLLQARAPDVSVTEQTLPRDKRRTLAQLRAMKGPLLLAWQHDIGAAADPLCPLCQQDAHSTEHLFGCPNIRTDLTPEDLWRRPVQAAELVQQWQDALDAALDAAEED